MEHQINDQWIELLPDGKRHMLKRVAFGEGPDSANCDGCVWAGNDNCDSNDMPCTTIDLGIVDENDLLSCPIETESKPWIDKPDKQVGKMKPLWSITCDITVKTSAGLLKVVGMVNVKAETLEEAKALWNRRPV